MDAEQISRVRQTFPCFEGISDQQWGLSGARLISLPARSAVITEGHLFEHASFVLRGCVRIFKISPTGKELTLYRVRKGEFCVIMMASILGETGYEATADIEEDTELLVLPVGLFRKWMHDDKQLNQFIYRVFIKRMVSVTARIPELMKRSPAAAEAYLHFERQVYEAPSLLPQKTKELIALTVAHVTGCPYCIDVHVKKYKALDGTMEEIMEALLVAASTRSGAILSHGLNALNSYEEAKEKVPQEGNKVDGDPQCFC